jgi:hypothetical protein
MILLNNEKEAKLSDYYSFKDSFYMKNRVNTIAWQIPTARRFLMGESF